MTSRARESGGAILRPAEECRAAGRGARLTTRRARPKGEGALTARTIGLVGTGVIGSGWAVRALARGHDVIAWDPAGGAEDRLRAAVERAWPSATRLGLFPGADPARLRWAGSPEDVAAGAGWVQESAPEHEPLKRSLLHRLDGAADPATVIASSSSGLLPSRLAEGLSHPERLLIGHPFNPVYLLPLVEVVPGEATAEETVAAAMAHYDDLVMYPLVVRNETEGYLSDRLQEALWRENLHLVNDGVATTAELDDSIVYGPGLRWAAMGTNLTFHLAGGESGIGAGRLVAEREARILAARASTEAGPWTPGTEIEAPLALYAAVVESDWVDYNGHMTEWAFLTVFGWASDALFRYLGIDEAYRAGGHSYYTVETHLNHRREASLGEPLRVTTQVLGSDAKRLHIFHTMYRDGEMLCTGEQMLVHVDTAAGRSAPLLPGPAAAVAAVTVAHASMPAPPQAGSRMAIPEPED